MKASTWKRADSGSGGWVRRAVAALLPVLASAALLLPGAGCRGTSAVSSCERCHAGLETASASHEGCVPCHGGHPEAATREAAHVGLLGLDDPSYPGRWEKGCGNCHRHEVDRMTSSQMFTNAGMIAQIQATWEGERPGAPFAAQGANRFATDGSPRHERAVGDLDHLSGELYRKFCARCHLARQNPADDGAAHPAGCAACHFPYGADAAYHGGDRTMRGKRLHSATHAMQGLPPMDACLRCHQRSGRIALSYQGLQDGNNALVPTRRGMPGPVPGSDDRTFTHIEPDVHHAAGMECIDCHTSREVMGDGYAAASMQGQLEIACEDCHGDGERRPRFGEAVRESDPPIRESRQYGRRIRPGFRMALTSRGRPYSNVFASGERVLVMLKRSGRLLASPVVTDTPEHRIVGHERMECSACHSRSVVQCYGCHTSYDKRENGYDFIAQSATPGMFSEHEDVRTLYPFPLALDSRGRISPVTPGCQTFVTVIEPSGERSRDESVALYRGKPQLRFAPFYGHNTGPRAVGCAACHGNPAFLGFGQYVLEKGDVRGTLRCEKSDEKSLDGFLSMRDGRITAYSAIARPNARPLDANEVRRVFTVNLCLDCHDSGRDPIWRRPMDTHALDDSLHRRLLAGDR